VLAAAGSVFAAGSQQKGEQATGSAGALPVVHEDTRLTPKDEADKILIPIWNR